ncbi:MAG: hypothetical protein ACLP7O_09895 [Terracidiphilus sp.]
MSCASHSCKRISFAGLMCVFILALCARAGVLRAQQTLPSDSQLPSAPIPASALAPVPAPAPAPVAVDAVSTAGSSPSSPGLNPGSPGSVHGRTAPRDASQGFSLWDGTLLDAIQLGGGTRSGRFSSPGGQPGSPRTGLSPWGGQPVDFKSLFQGINSPGFGRGLASGGQGPGTNGAAPGGLQFNQLNRGNLGMYMKSPADSFRVSYQDAFGTRSNGLDLAAGQGSVRATFNSSAFGNGMFNFSATSMVGSGPMAGSMRSLSASPSAPAATGARPTTSLSLKLSF